MAQALGLLETKGYVGAVTGADAMLKTGHVSLVGRETTGGGYMTVIVRGEQEEVEKAVNVGAKVAERVGELISSHVVVDPHARLSGLLPK